MGIYELLIMNDVLREMVVAIQSNQQQPEAIEH